MHEKNHAGGKMSVGENAAVKICLALDGAVSTATWLTCPNLDTWNRQCHGL
jgi:hypothetical protein